MKKIATLGPVGTFTELAAKKYIKEVKEKLEIVLYPSIIKSCNAVGNECELGIIPIENTLDGYVQRSLDLLLQTDIKIINELYLPIQFSFVSNEKDLKNVKKIYAQFKTQGQCVKFLDQFESSKIITTESNGISYNEIKKGNEREAAIVPNHILDHSNNFEYIIDNVTDYSKNETRFVVVSKNPIIHNVDKNYKTSLIILDVADEPGALSNILNEFAKRSINIHSIMSRPEKTVMGKYHFFIDIQGAYPNDKLLKEAIDKIKIKNKLKVAGSYFALN